MSLRRRRPLCSEWGDPLRIDPEDLRRHYRSISDEELMALDRGALTEIAQKLYDEEVARRDFNPEQELELSAPGEVELVDAELDVDTGPPPDWLEDAACVCAFAAVSETSYATEVAEARAVLRRAGIPCCVTLNRADPSGGAAARSEYCVMVPSAFNLHATSVLDRDIFNARQEEEWRTHFQALSDDDLRVQKVEILCAGLLDRVARLRKVYEDEMSQRGLKPR